jgi:hypothetical protein
MKVIQSNEGTVTLELQREELKDLHNALGRAITALEREPGILNELIRECDGIEDEDEVRDLIYEAGREEVTVEELKKSLERAKRLLPKVYDLSEGFMKLCYAQT